MKAVNTLDAIKRALQENQRYHAAMLKQIQQQIDDIKEELSTKASFLISANSTYTTQVLFDTKPYEED